MGGDEFSCSDGTRLRIVEDGDPSAPVTVVLAHCYALSHEGWDPLLPELAAACGTPIRVLRYDHRGYGESDPMTADTATLAWLGDDLAEVIVQRATAGPVVLVGHSMGGMAIMAMAERHPELVADRVAGVAFVATACSGLGRMSFGLPGPVAALIHRAERAGVWLLSAAGRPVLTRYPRVLEPFVRWLVFGENPMPGDVAHVARLLAACRPLTMLLFRPDFDAHDRREALANLAGSPATVMVGDRDRLTPPRCAAEIAEWLPGARFVLLPGAGHMLPHERTAEVAAAVGELVQAALRRQTVEAS
jgi:pimeloyl-ACP methyl ester carboxylesterase